MGMSTLQLPETFSIGKYTFGLDDDFLWYISPHLWTSLITGTATVAISASAAGGVVVLTTGAVANQDCAVKTTNSSFLIAANKPIEGEATIQYSEAATNAANVCFAICDAIVADTLINAGAGPKASFSGAMIYKVDGDTKWRCIVSIAAVRTIINSTLVAGGAAYQRLKIEIRPVSATVAEASFFCDSGSGMVPLYDAAQTARNVPIKISFTYTGAAAMQCGTYVKAGAGGTSEVVNVDRLTCFQAR